MREKPLPLNAAVDLWPWEHFNQEYLTQFGGLPPENSVFNLGILL